MNLSIRDYIVNNFKDSDEEEIRQAIEDSIKEKDEITLPGLGVFFEIMWKGLNDKDKDNVIKSILNTVKKND
jgi:small acid-soluble spore protein I (minor)